MGYINAKDVFPTNLLIELQKYAQGKLLYIPKQEWGTTLNGAKELFQKRNQKIFNSYKKGESVEILMERFHLSEESIRKIITK